MNNKKKKNNTNNTSDQLAAFENENDRFESADVDVQQSNAASQADSPGAVSAFPGAEESVADERSLQESNSAFGGNISGGGRNNDSGKSSVGGGRNNDSGKSSVGGDRNEKRSKKDNRNKSDSRGKKSGRNSALDSASGKMSRYDYDEWKTRVYELDDLRMKRKHTWIGTEEEAAELEARKTLIMQSRQQAEAELNRQTGRYTGQYDDGFASRQTGRYTGQYDDGFAGRQTGRYTGQYDDGFASRQTGRITQYDIDPPFSAQRTTGQIDMPPGVNEQTSSGSKVGPAIRSAGSGVSSAVRSAGSGVSSAVRGAGSGILSAGSGVVSAGRYIGHMRKNERRKFKGFIAVVVLFAVLLMFEASYFYLKSDLAKMPGETQAVNEQIEDLKAENEKIEKETSEMGDYDSNKELKESWERLRDKLKETTEEDASL